MMRLGGSSLRAGWAVPSAVPSAVTRAAVAAVAVPRLASVASYHLVAATAAEADNQNANAGLVRYVNAWRTNGHYFASIDPLGLYAPAGPIKVSSVRELQPATYGLDKLDPSTEVPLAGVIHMTDASGNARTTATLAEVMAHVQTTYAGSIGAEVHVSSAKERAFLIKHLEASAGVGGWNVDDGARKTIQELMTRSEVFDLFMTKRYTQVKRYGLEGAEALMASVMAVLTEARAGKVDDVVVGIAHRGRLNLLVDLLGMDPAYIFAKVNGVSELPDDVLGDGDVLSHLAISCPVATEAGDVNVSLLHNPSHLEAINPVALGKIRAKQDRVASATAKRNAMALQIHGDSAFAGQGIIYEGMNLARLPDYETRGSVHIITNNQVGFTATHREARSTPYASDIAKTFDIPVFHVNGDDPEAVYLASRVAALYRNRFKKDAVIDLYGYRRWGHNEVDEPSFTQPKMYAAIRAKKSVPAIYEEDVVAKGLKTVEQLAEERAEREAFLNDRNSDVMDKTFAPQAFHLTGAWSGMTQAVNVTDTVETGYDAEALREIAVASVTVPDAIKVHSRLDRLYIKDRRKRIADGTPLDWATAETLAFGSLLRDGNDVRISGQDVGRGTFSQRHVKLTCQDSNNAVFPLNEAGYEGRMHVANSHLSEFAVVGYEYGYSWNSPRALVMWEAQFGDFANGAQIMLDNFVATGETKWLRQSGLVIALPHGFDGMGPEHSSARVERWLQLTDIPMTIAPGTPQNVNWRVIHPSTPANYFHALRRQCVTPYRKPLVVVGPKVLLRLPECVSPLEDLAEGTTFQPVIGDSEADASAVKTVVLTSGKLYYDLAKRREAEGRDDVAIVRLEEYAPFPADAILDNLSGYTNAEHVVWAQEEHENMGAWSWLQPRLASIGIHAKFSGRPAAACPTGRPSVHKAAAEAVIAGPFQF